MRRAAVTAAVAAAAVAVVVALGGAGSGNDRPTFWLELDNAFGVVVGGDVKVAGVRAGTVSDLDVDERTMRAKVGMTLEREGFGDLRTDTFCEVRPQSLIGEYFIDCLPGSKPQRLARGATIPVTQTGGTVPADLVANILRRPYRERFSLILAELGTGVAARGEDLGAAIRRASPALRATQKTLGAIAHERRALQALIGDARVVIEALADDKRAVSRFVTHANDTARISAAREREIGAQWRELPGFLRELRPAMRRLGRVADRQRPALAGLRRQAGGLTTLLDRTEPFLDRSRPFTRSLASVSREGNRGVKAIDSRVKELATWTGSLPELATNLSLVLEDLDDRGRAVEPDERSPGGKGFTGLEALVRFAFFQQQAANVYDGNSYMAKTGAFVDPLCSTWSVVAQARDETRKRCRAQLGPSRPGIDSPDPTATGTKQRSKPHRKTPGRPGKTTPKLPAAKAPQPAVPKVPDAAGGVLDSVEKLLDDLLPGAGKPRPGGRTAGETLLDFLMAP